jgi:hypothetical protein
MVDAPIPVRPVDRRHGGASTKMVSATPRARLALAYKPAPVFWALAPGPLAGPSPRATQWRSGFSHSALWGFP